MRRHLVRLLQLLLRRLDSSAEPTKQVSHVRTVQVTRASHLAHVWPMEPEAEIRRALKQKD